MNTALVKFILFCVCNLLKNDYFVCLTFDLWPWSSYVFTELHSDSLMDRLYLHEDSRDYKSSLIICPVQFNLSLLSWAPSAFYFPWILASVLIFLNAARLLCHFQPGAIRYNLKNLSPSLCSYLWGIHLKLDLEISQVCFYFYQTTRLFKNINTHL